MEREILFRGKLSHSGEWITGNLITARNGNLYIIPPTVFESDGHHLIIDSDSPFLVLPETISQFTGLTDKSGTKIFEGNIVKSTYLYKGESTVIVGVVEIDAYNPCFVIHYKWQGNGHDCYEYDFVQCGLRENEVIGDIYDNPELL